MPQSILPKSKELVPARGGDEKVDVLENENSDSERLRLRRLMVGTFS
jgi:hypothetical protein